MSCRKMVNIDELITETQYFNYNEIVSLSKRVRDVRIARKKWDNSINIEYVSWLMEPQYATPGLAGGYAKIYISAQSDYYKKVEHTYKPTQDDINATDWYIL